MNRTMHMNEALHPLSIAGLQETLQLPDPSRAVFLGPQDAPPLKSLLKDCASGLEAPIGCASLREIVGRAKHVTLLIPDGTRRIPLQGLMSPVLKALESYGLKPRNIGVIVAVGTHKGLGSEDLEDLVGLKIFERYAVLNHDWKNEDSMFKVGTFDGNVPVLINELLFESDVVIGLGQIRPHRVAGYTGGCKIIVPGVAGRRAVEWTHWKSAQSPSEDMTFHVDNPVRLAIENVCQDSHLKFIVNVVTNAQGKPCGLFAGHPVTAHREGVRFADTVYPRPDGRKFPIVVAVCPHDPDLWQAASGIYEGSLWVEEGGSIILVAPCPEGVAHHAEVLQHGYLSLEEATDRIRAGKLTNMVVAAHLVHVGDVHHKKAKVTLVSDGIKRSETAKLGLNYQPDLQSALDAALAQHGPDAPILFYSR